MYDLVLPHPAMSLYCELHIVKFQVLLQRDDGRCRGCLQGYRSFTGQEMHLSFTAPGAKGAERMVVVDGIQWRKDSGQSIKM